MKNEQLVFGVHAVEAVLQSDPHRIRRLHVQKGGDQQFRLAGLLKQAQQQGITIEYAERSTLDRQTDGKRHQGVVAWCQPLPKAGEQELDVLLDGLTEPAFLLILDGVQDPHNLGACLRSADGAGVHAVIVPRDKAVGITSVVSKVASGAAETMPFFQVTNLARTLRELQQRGIWITGLDERGESTVFEANFSGPMALVMGAEGKGLRRLTREHCDYVISIPMAGGVESLNVSVATGICLYEAFRQRGLL